MIRWLPPRAVELGVVALLLLMSRAAAAGPAAKTFATPEAVIAHFVTSVAADDFDGAMDAFDIEDQVAHFDFAAQVRRMGGFVATYTEAPPRYKLYARTNALEAMQRAANVTLNWAYGLLTGGTKLKDQTIADPRTQLQTLDLTKLRDLTLVRIDTPNKSFMSQPKALELFRKQAAARGAKDSTERIALLRLGDQHYWCGFRLLEIGSSWHLEDLSSNLASGTSSSLIGVEKTTPEEFEAHTK